MVPKAELTDRSGIQGMFTLSQDYRLNLDASYSYLLLHLVSMFGA